MIASGDIVEILCDWKSVGYRSYLSGDLEFINIFIPYRVRNPTYPNKAWEYKVIRIMKNEPTQSWEDEDEYSAYMSGEPSPEEIKRQISYMFECDDYFES